VAVVRLYLGWDICSCYVNKFCWQVVALGNDDSQHIMGNLRQPSG
jgi:hypothetical protein